MQRDNDLQLIQDTLAGDDDAFGVLVQKHQKGIHALAWRKTGDFHIAEEITQDTFLQAYRRLSTLRNPNQFAGWLYVIANRLCIRWFKKKKIQTLSLEDTPQHAIDAAAYTHYESQQRESDATEYRQQLVKQLLAKLPESERTVVTLYYLSEMTTREIGKFLGVSVNTITSRLQRARQRLQTEQENFIQEVLSSIQIPASLRHDIMRQVADIKPIPAPAPKPFIPWVAFGTAILLIALLLGTTNRYLIRFQRPYNFEALSEPTIEIIDAFIVLDIDAKPNLRNQIGQDPSSNNDISASLHSAEMPNAPQTANQNRVLTQEQQQKNIEICTQNLLAIGKSIQAYQKDNEYLPEWLSDLYPKYLSDANLLICPADTSDGKALYHTNIDPNTSTSYGYQFHSEYRAVKNAQRLLYGDVIPLVRCRHHANDDFEVLNLSFSSQVYTSSATWEETQDQMYSTTEAAISTFEEIIQQFPEDYYNLHPKLDSLYAKLENEQSTNTRRIDDPIQEMIGKPVPNFSAIDLEGNPISLQDYRGKVVLLHFWAAWSNASTAEMISIKKIYDTYKDQDFDIIGISFDTEKNRLRNYINQNDIQWPQIFDFNVEDEAKLITRQYHIRAIPALWLIDKDGRLISSGTTSTALEQLITKTLNKPSKHL